MNIALGNTIGNHTWVHADRNPVGYIFIEGERKGTFRADPRCAAFLTGDALRQIADECDKIAKS